MASSAAAAARRCGCWARVNKQTLDSAEECAIRRQGGKFSKASTLRASICRRSALGNMTGKTRAGGRVLARDGGSPTNWGACIGPVSLWAFLPLSETKRYLVLRKTGAKLPTSPVARGSWGEVSEGRNYCHTSYNYYRALLLSPRQLLLTA